MGFRKCKLCGRANYMRIINERRRISNEGLYYKDYDEMCPICGAIQ